MHFLGSGGIGGLFHSLAQAFGNAAENPSYSAFSPILSIGATFFLVLSEIFSIFG